MIDLIKIFGIILIIFSTSYIGFNKSGVFQKRIDELSEFKKGIEKLKTEIAFVKTPLCDAFLKISEHLDENISSVFNEFSVSISTHERCSITDIWDFCINKYSKNSCMNKNDIKILCDFGTMLGSTDLDGQINNFTSVIEMLDSQIAEAIIEKDKNAGLYRNFGVYAGILISILLI